MSAKRFRVEGHADKVEVGIEAVNLERILDVVVGRAVAVVVGVLARCRPVGRCAGRPASWSSCGGSGLRAQDVGAKSHAVRRSPCCCCSAA